MIDSFHNCQLSGYMTWQTISNFNILLAAEQKVTFNSDLDILFFGVATVRGIFYTSTLSRHIQVCILLNVLLRKCSNPKSVTNITKVMVIRNKICLRLPLFSQPVNPKISFHICLPSLRFLETTKHWAARLKYGRLCIGIYLVRYWLLQYFSFSFIKRWTFIRLVSQFYNDDLVSKPTSSKHPFSTSPDLVFYLVFYIK